MGPSDTPRSNAGPQKDGAHVIVEPAFTHYRFLRANQRAEYTLGSEIRDLRNKSNCKAISAHNTKNRTTLFFEIALKGQIVDCRELRVEFD